MRDLDKSLYDAIKKRGKIIVVSSNEGHVSWFDKIELEIEGEHKKAKRKKKRK